MSKMTVRELIELARNREVTEEDIQRLEERMTAREAEFEAQARARAVTPEFLERTYTL